MEFRADECELHRCRTMGVMRLWDLWESHATMCSTLSEDEVDEDAMEQPVVWRTRTDGGERESPIVILSEVGNEVEMV